MEDCLVDAERRGNLGIMCGDEKIFFLLHLFCILIMVIEAKARHGEIKFKKVKGQGSSFRKYINSQVSVQRGNEVAIRFILAYR